MVDNAHLAVLVIRQENCLRVILRQRVNHDSLEEVEIGIFEPHMLGVIAAFAAAARICEEFGLEEPQRVGFEE